MNKLLTVVALALLLGTLVLAYLLLAEDWDTLAPFLRLVDRL